MPAYYMREGFPSYRRRGRFRGVQPLPVPGQTPGRRTGSIEALALRPGTCDLAYIRTLAERSYQAALTEIRRRYFRSRDMTTPSLALVAFPKPYSDFHMFNRSRRGDDAAFERHIRNR